MTQIVDLYREARKTNFYIPQFEVKIREADLPRNVLRDIVDITYSDDHTKIDSFQITLNNWDPETNKFKYIGAETRDSMRDNPLHTLFDPCRREVKIKMGYPGNWRTMVKGNFVTNEPRFTSQGRPSVSVRGLNVLHKLRRCQQSRSWRNKRISEIVKSLEQDDFPIPIQINDKALNEEPCLEFVAQRSEYDIDFIFAQARKQGYVAVIVQNNENQNGENEDDDDPDEHLYFGPSNDEMPHALRDVMYKLEWGKSLIDFTPTLTTAHQVRSVTVRGWSRGRGRDFSATVGIDDERLNRDQDLYEVLRRCDPREEVVVDAPVFNRTQAREKAIAILQDLQREMVKASGTTIGLPDLRAGKKIIIENVGVRLSGTYFITETTHTINNAGYITKFKARREIDGNRGVNKTDA